MLVRSIRKFHPEAPILTFIPEGSIEQMDERIVSELEEQTTVETGPVPIQEYMVSTFAESWRRAFERFESDCVVVIDTDAVLLNPVVLPDVDADLYAAPAHIGVRNLWSVDGPYQAEWEYIFDLFDVPLPEKTVSALSDKAEMYPPVYNAGVIAGRDPELPERLLDMSEELYNDEKLTMRKYFAEMYALAVIAADPSVQFHQLSDQYNCMMGGYSYVPDDVQILHYQFFDTLSTLRNPRHIELLESLDVKLNPRLSDYGIRALSYSVFNIGRVSNPETFHRFLDITTPIFDWNNPDPEPVETE